jgi:heterodisulfide reductase subunit C
MLYGSDGADQGTGRQGGFSVTDDPTPKEFFEAQKKARTDDVGLQHVASWHCGRCLSYCPVGNWGASSKQPG